MISTPSDNSKEKVRGRMLKSAAQLWGLQPAEIAALDPLVGMLIGACSVEIAKVYEELNSSHSRVLERISKLLTPEVYKGPVPAHAVMHTHSVEPESYVDEYVQLFYRKNIPSKESTIRDNFRDVFFTPAIQSKIFDGAIRYMVSGNSGFKIENVINKEKAFDAMPGKKVDDGVLWLGLDLNDKISSIDGLSFYFDWINNIDRNQFFNFLPLTQWYIEDEQVSVDTGYNSEVKKLLNDLNLEAYPDVSRATQKNVLAIYNNRYVSLKWHKDRQPDLQAQKKKHPDVFKNIFPARALGAFEKNYLWVKVVFPPFVSQEMISDVFCAINCVPVINRKFNDFSYRFQTNFNIIPLGTGDDYFFNIEAVRSNDGTQYNSTQVFDANKLGAGNYIVRKGGIERFDNRNASELLSYLVDLLRDESAGFSVYGQDMLLSTLKELNQLINALNQKVKVTNNNKEPITYVILKPLTNSANVFIEFWSTSGEFANNLKLGTGFNIYGSAGIKTDNLMLVTSSQGGNNPLSGMETLYAFKNALMTRDRIVTIADIKYFCFRELGDRLKGVEVKRGIVNDNRSFTGFIKTVDVYLETNATARNDEEWEIICRTLLVKLESKSASNFKFRVFVKK